MFDGRFTNTPHVHRGRAFLDARAMVHHPVAVFEKYRTQLGPTFSFHFGGARATVVTTDPVVLEHVLRGNRDNYQKSDIQVARMAEFQGQGLVNSHGDTWLRQRRLLAHGFRPSHLATLLPLQQGVLHDLMAGFERDVQRGPVDIHQQMVRFTLRLVGRALFGRSLTDAELQQIGDAIAEIQAFILRQVVQPYKRRWFRLTGEYARYQRIRVAADTLVLRHIQERLNHDGGGHDFLRLLMESTYHDTGERMSQAQVLIESLQLMVAGNETSSNALTWIFYLLARHPRYIRELRNEVESVIGDRSIDYHNLHQLSGTRRVIDEALRLYPPFWTIDRIALHDDDIAGIHIPAGTLVMPYIYGTHRNPGHWRDAETFDPGRFEPEQSHTRHPFAYIPFGGGPRVCIGNNMAVMQILLIVATFVRTYDFRLTQDLPIATRPRMLLRPAGAVSMTFRRAS